MIMIQRRGDGMRPRLHCVGCRQPLTAREAWLAFVPLDQETKRAEGRWMHKACADGHATHLFRIFAQFLAVCRRSK